jgi:hypothetical protein
VPGGDPEATDELAGPVAREADDRLAVLGGFNHRQRDLGRHDQKRLQHGETPFQQVVQIRRRN